MIVSISVLMSVYQGEKPEYLKQCLESLLIQTKLADETVIVYDGPVSKEITDVVDDFLEPLKIRVVPLKHNVGLAAALNEGLKHCSHDLVIRMDTDDISVPKRLEIQLNYMESNPDISASSGYIEEFSDDGKILSCRVLPLDHDSLAIFAMRRSPLSHPAVIFRKQHIIEVGGYPPLRNAQDFALWSLLLMRGYRLANIPEVLVHMRTGSAMLKRRGWLQFKREVALLKYQYGIGLLNKRSFVLNLFARAFLRLSPNVVKKMLYKYAR
jgi:glycosyltransferase involved in cell wall biosynthesis